MCFISLVCLLLFGHGFVLEQGFATREHDNMKLSFFKESIVDSYIHGGEGAKLGDIPHQVSFQHQTHNYHFCGGSIINERWIITAAHCVNNSDPVNIKIITGTVDRTKPGVVAQIQKIIIHPKYSFRRSPFTILNDVGLVKLMTPLEFDDNIKPIELPPASHRISEGKVLVSGWGMKKGGGQYPKELNKVHLDVVDQKTCEAIYKKNGGTVVPETALCAGDKAGNKSQCLGDSGGPYSDSNGFLVGIVSWGLAICSHENFPSVAEEVAYHVDWIKKTIQDDN